MNRMHPIDPEKACPFVGETLRELRKVVGHAATVLGFVGCPYTLATYLIEVSIDYYCWGNGRPKEGGGNNQTNKNPATFEALWRFFFEFYAF